MKKILLILCIIAISIGIFADGGTTVPFRYEDMIGGQFWVIDDDGISVNTDDISVATLNVGAELLADTEDFSGDWTLAGDFDLATTDFEYNDATHTGTLTQANADFAGTLASSTWYILRILLSDATTPVSATSIVVTLGTSAINIELGAAQTYYYHIKSDAVVTGDDFVITVTGSSAGDITGTMVSLQESGASYGVFHDLLVSNDLKVENDLYVGCNTYLGQYTYLDYDAPIADRDIILYFDTGATNETFMWNDGSTYFAFSDDISVGKNVHISDGYGIGITFAAEQLKFYSAGYAELEGADFKIKEGSFTQETYVIRKHVAITGAVDNTATNLFTITTTDETGDVDGGSYTVNMWVKGGESTAVGATNTAVMSMNCHFGRVMVGAGTGANSAVGEISQSAEAAAGTGGVNNITITVVETSEYVQTIQVTVDVDGGTADASVTIELLYSVFTTPPVIAGI